MITLTFKIQLNSDVNTFLNTIHSENDAIISTSVGAYTVVVEIEDVIAIPYVEYQAHETNLKIIETTCKADINSLGAEKLETAQEILNNRSDWLGFEFNIVNAENIVNAFKAGVSIHVISYMQLSY